MAPKDIVQGLPEAANDVIAPIEAGDELVIDDRILDAIREKLFADASKRAFGRLDDFNLNTLRGLAMNQALLQYPKLLDIMDDVLLKVSASVQGVLEEGSTDTDTQEDGEAFSLLLKRCGTWFYKHGYASQALRAFEGAMKFYPDDQDMLTTVADIYYSNGDWLEAADFYRKIYVFSPEIPMVQRRLAHINTVMGERFLATDVNTAYNFFEAACSYFPDYPDAICGMGDVEFMSGNFFQARVHFAYALELEPSSVRALTGLANVHAHLNEDDAAESMYAEALHLNQYYPHALYGMARFQFIQRGNSLQALEYVDRVLKIREKDLTALTLKSDICIDLRRFDEAEEVLREILHLQPQDREAFMKYSRIKNGECFMPSQYGMSSEIMAVHPNRRLSSRDFYFSLAYLQEPNNEGLFDEYARHVEDEQEYRFDFLHSAFDKKILN